MKKDFQKLVETKYGISRSDKIAERVKTAQLVPPIKGTVKVIKPRKVNLASNEKYTQAERLRKAANPPWSTPVDGERREGE